MPLYIPVIVGTTRPGRYSIHPARLIHRIGASIEGVESDLLDPSAFKVPLDGRDEETRDSRYAGVTHRADGFFVVTPEYNHSVPGSLKRFLDSELKGYRRKPVAFAGVSSGPWGGVRAIEALALAVRAMGLVAVSIDVQFPRVRELFDEKGEPTDSAYERRVSRVWVELIWMARALKWGRENLPEPNSGR